jgi:hypothetical protein
MARKLAHEDGERGRESDEESADGGEGALLNRRKYMELGGAAVAALATGSLSAAAQDGSGGTVYQTDFSEGQL